MKKSDDPPIADYALIGDCRAAALVCRDGAIDWCCMPRFDSGACFARLLDRESGGYCSVEPVDPCEISRQYLDDTLVLQTTFSGDRGEATITDCIVTAKAAGEECSQIIRIIEGRRGSLDLRLRVVPRFDYGEVDAWIHHLGDGAYSAIGGDDALLIWSDAGLEA